MLVFRIDPVVRDDRTQRFLGRYMLFHRCGRAFAHHVTCRCERPVRHNEALPRSPSRLPLATLRAARKSTFFGQRVFAGFACAWVACARSRLAASSVAMTMF